MASRYAVQPPDLSFLAGRHVLLALSGGADSMALLCMLADARDAGLLRLSAAHFQHGIRGEDAREDERFCRRACLERGVAYYAGEGDVPAEAARTGEGLETAARRMRYAFLEKTRRECGADVIALAHHADDQAETILMHLLRGAGASGMRGMDRLSGTLARPLLDMRKAEILAYLEERGVPWREDATNAEADNPRNILRLEAMPALEKAYPGAVEAVCRHGRIVREEDALLERMTDEFLAKRRKIYPFGEYLALPGGEETAILRRAVRRMMGKEATMEQVLRVSALAGQARGAVDASAFLRAEKCPGGLYVLRLPPPEKPEASLRLPGETALPGLGIFTADLRRSGPILDDPLRQALRPEALEGAVLRTRRPGDRIHPLGMEGSKSLSDYMIDRGLDRPLRDWLPLVAVGNEVLWAVGLGISRLAALSGPGMAAVLTFTQEEYRC